MRAALLALLLTGCATTDLPGSPPRIIDREGALCTWIDSTEGETITYTDSCPDTQQPREVTP
jgi:hypothetical protein